MWKKIAAIAVLCFVQTAVSVGVVTAAPPYANSTTGAFGNTANPCTGTSFTRTIVVNDDLIVADLDVGLQITHSWRLDTRATLISPSGTSVRLLNDSNGAGPQFVNYNVRLDDEATVLVNTGTHGSDPATPQYSSRVRPNAALSAFNGQNARGTWTLLLCDVYVTDDGTFVSAELFISNVPDPGDPPILSCGASALRHDWNANAWPAGAFSRTYALGDDDLRVSIAGATSNLLADPETGAQTPVTSTYYTGGNGTAEQGLFVLANFPSNTSTLTYTIDVGDLSGGANPGVDELQFSLLDIDFGSASFQDRLTITGSHAGSSVTPTLTASQSNSVSANVATGTAPAGQDSSFGTVTVTFQDRVSSITITYGSGPLAPTNPNNQGIALYDILTCPATMAVLQANKTNRIHDDLYALPGNDVVYTIGVSNVGDGATDNNSIVLIDSMPAEVAFYRGPLANDAVTFTETGATGLDFVYSRDVGYSNSATKPADFSQCSYAPTTGYDPAVTFICFNPKSALAPGTGFAFEFRARIK